MSSPVIHMFTQSFNNMNFALGLNLSSLLAVGAFSILARSISIGSGAIDLRPFDLRPIDLRITGID